VSHPGSFILMPMMSAGSTNFGPALEASPIPLGSPSRMSSAILSGAGYLHQSPSRPQGPPDAAPSRARARGRRGGCPGRPPCNDARRGWLHSSRVRRPVAIACLASAKRLPIGRELFARGQYAKRAALDVLDVNWFERKKSQSKAPFVSATSDKASARLDSSKV
jgi:hypothetical protein